MALQTQSPRSRRALLGAALGGLGGLVVAAFGRPESAEAAAGDALKIGQSNSAGSSQTVLTSAAGGAAFTLKDTADAGTGIFGWSSATTGAGRGLYGRSDAPGGFGVQAKNTGTVGGGAALQALGGNNTAVDASTNGFYAVSAESTSGTGRALDGYASNTGPGANYGVYGLANGALGYGVSGRANHSTGTTHGVYGDAYSSNGFGVEGYNPYYIGVYGLSSTGLAGVYGDNLSAGDGVYGHANNGWAGHFDPDCRVEGSFQVGGDAAVTGNLSKGGGSFRIDHPLDPANRILQHSFVESPDMLNVYAGRARADGTGAATVTLAPWFAALNRDLRYQLTPVRRAMPDLHVSAERSDGFSIAGAAPGGELCWQVTGVRQDAWANAHRIEVELDKSAADRGRYLHPAEHGKPVSRGIDHAVRERHAALRPSAALRDAPPPAG